MHATKWDTKRLVWGTDHLFHLSYLFNSHSLQSSQYNSGVSNLLWQPKSFVKLTLKAQQMSEVLYSWIFTVLMRYDAIISGSHSSVDEDWGCSAVSLVGCFPVFWVNVMSPSLLIEQSKNSWNGRPLKITALQSFRMLATLTQWHRVTWFLVICYEQSEEFQ